ncbi:hypothetical protein ACJQWK_06982 [Exserohilum turcicum]
MAVIEDSVFPTTMCLAIMPPTLHCLVLRHYAHVRGAIPTLHLPVWLHSQFPYARLHASPFVMLSVSIRKAGCRASPSVFVEASSLGRPSQPAWYRAEYVAYSSIAPLQGIRFEVATWISPHGHLWSKQAKGGVKRREALLTAGKGVIFALTKTG